MEIQQQLQLQIWGSVCPTAVPYNALVVFTLMLFIYFMTDIQSTPNAQNLPILCFIL